MRWVATVLLVLASVHAHADGDAQEGEQDPKAIAKRLFTEGRLLYDQGKHIEACLLFDKSNQLDPAIGTRFNLAECAEREGKPRAAWLMWIAAADEADAASDPRGKFARQRADALASKLGTVVVRVAKPKRKGLEIEIGGRTVKPAGEIVERVDTSRVVITAKAPNRESFSKTVSVAIGTEVEVEIPALARLPGQAVEEEDVPAGNPWIALTVGSAVVALGGTATWIVATGRVSDAERVSQDLANRGMNHDDVDADGRRWSKITYVAGGIMMAGTIATIVFTVKGVQRHARKRDATSVRLVPVLAPQVAGMQLDLRF